MIIRLSLMSSLCSALALLLPSPPVSADSPDQIEPVVPTTFLEFHNQMVECITYFRYMQQDLDKLGASRADIDRYGEMDADLSLLYWSIGKRLSRKEQRKTLSERQARKHISKPGDLDDVKSEFDLRCVALHENFDTYVENIEKRLELASGEPYVALKDKCVTISTDWLTLTGRYLGMIGPSVEPVPRGGLKPIDFGAGDRYKIAVAVGSLEFWNTVEIPPPPEAHLELLEMDPAAQAKVLAEPLAEYRVTCKQPRNPFFRGLDARGTAYWAVACEDGNAFAIWITEEHGIKRHYNCKPIRGYKQPSCYEPCWRSACYTVNKKIEATDEYVPHTTSVHVEKAPAQACPKEYASFITQNRGQLPDLAAGEVHRPSMAIIDAPDCNAPDKSGRRTLEIYATRALDMLKVDLATVEATPMQLDRSSGPPCELMHINANIDQLADFRCRLTGDPDEIAKAGPILTVRGGFRNGDPMEGQVEVCRKQVD